MQTAFERRMVSLKQHVLNNSSKNKNIYAVLKREVSSIVRAGSEVLKKHSLTNDLICSSQTAGISYHREDMNGKDSAYVKKHHAWVDHPEACRKYI